MPRATRGRRDKAPADGNHATDSLPKAAPIARPSTDYKWKIEQRDYGDKEARDEQRRQEMEERRKAREAGENVDLGRAGAEWERAAGVAGARSSTSAASSPPLAKGKSKGKGKDPPKAAIEKGHKGAAHQALAFDTNNVWAAWQKHSNVQSQKDQRSNVGWEKPINGASKAPCESDAPKSRSKLSPSAIATASSAVKACARSQRTGGDGDAWAQWRSNHKDGAWEEHNGDIDRKIPGSPQDQRFGNPVDCQESPEAGKTVCQDDSSSIREKLEAYLSSMRNKGQLQKGILVLRASARDGGIDADLAEQIIHSFKAQAEYELDHQCGAPESGIRSNMGGDSSPQIGVNHLPICVVEEPPQIDAAAIAIPDDDDDL